MRAKQVQTGLLITLLILTVCITAVVAEEEMVVPLGTIELSAPEDVEATRSAVAFPHAQHFDFACNVCHHEWTYDDPESLGCMTSGCHDVTEAPKDKSEAMLYFKNAYHASCIGCHKEIKAKNKAMEMSKRSVEGNLARTGPTSCNACHPKE